MKNENTGLSFNMKNVGDNIQKEVIDNKVHNR